MNIMNELSVIVHDGFYWLIYRIYGAWLLRRFCRSCCLLPKSIILFANHERSILLVRSDCNHQTVEASSNPPPETSTIGCLFVCLIALWLITFAWLFGFGCYGALWVIRIHDKSCIKQPALRLSSGNKNVLLDWINWNVGKYDGRWHGIPICEALQVRTVLQVFDAGMVFSPEKQSESSWSWGSKPVRSRHRPRLRSGCPVTLKGKVLGVQASFRWSLEFQEATA